MTKTARKAVAALAAVLGAWLAFVLNSEPSQITGPEIGLLVTNLVAVFVAWLTPNDPVLPLVIPAAEIADPWVPPQHP